MDCKNDEIFSPVKNSDEENKQHSDSFSEFLKGPGAFRKISKTEGDVNENTFSTKSISSKTLQDKSAKNEANQAKISSSSSTLDDALLIRLESSCSLKKVEADNVQSGSTKNNKDLSDTSLAAMHDQQIEAQCEIERKHASNTNMSQLCSLQGNAAIVSRATTSKEIKKTKQQTLFSQCDPSSQLCSVTSEADVSVNSGSKEIVKTKCSSSSQQNLLSELCSVESSVKSEAVDVSEAFGFKEIEKSHPLSSLKNDNPLSQIQSMVERMVSDAVESQVDNLQQLIWSHHHSVSKVLLETKETMENNHASEKETLCKIMEELAEENRQLRNAASGHE